MEDLKKLFSRVKDSLLRNSTSVEALNEVIGVINILSAQVIAEASPLTEEQTKFFYGEFFKELCQRIGNCEIKAVASQEKVAELMRSLVDLLAAELKMNTPNCMFMVEQMRHIFDHKNKFYKHLIDLAIA